MTNKDEYDIIYIVKEKETTSMKTFFKFTAIAIMITIIIWFLYSFADINIHNTTDQNYSNFNMFIMFVKFIGCS